LSKTFTGKVVDCIKGENTTKVILDAGDPFYIEKDKSIPVGSQIFVEIEDSTKYGGNYFTHVAKVKIGNEKIFIVHGRDEQMRDAIELFLTKNKITATILKDQANSGKTIIEKFEACSNTDYAIILLSPDDEGHILNSNDPLQYRARQNVIFELGYFIGKLGRSNVSILIKDKVDIPSDITGIGYINFDNAKGWEPKLANELKHAGFKI